MTRLVPSLRLRTVAMAALFGFTTFFVSVAPDQPRDPRPEALTPQTAEAAYCASAPTFSGYLSDGLATPSMDTRSTTGDVYGYLTNIGSAWSCTAFYRYDGVAWAKAADGSTGNFDWGTLIDSISVACNWDVGSTDFIKANETNDCPDSDTEYAMPIHLADTSISTLLEGVYHNDHSPDQLGDFMFIHTDCDSYYGAADGNDDGERMQYGESFLTSNAGNRPGANCDPLILDPTDNTQTIIVDGSPPDTGFDWPATGTSGTIRSAYASVRFDATDNLAGFSGSDDWDLQRRKGTWDGSSCTALANDGSPTSGTTAALDQVVTQPLEVGPCYQWTLAARDANGNVAAVKTSGTVVVDPGPTLGLPSWSPTETWDLGAGDSLSVNPATGNLVVSHPVLELPIRGSSVGLSLTYNRHDTTNVGMGPGWRLDVLRRLAIAANGDVTFTAGDGSRHVFTWNAGTSTFTRPPTLYASLVKDLGQTAHEYVLTYRDRSVDKFDIVGSNAVLVREEDRFGNGVTISPSSTTPTTITDAANRTITLGWTSGKLTSISDWVNVAGGIVQTSGTGNRLHRFFYDTPGQLIGWAGPLNTSGTCTAGQPSGASHLTCLAYPTNGFELTKTQTVTTLSGSALSTTTRTGTTALKTSVTFAGSDVTVVKDAQEVANATSGTTFSHPSAWTTRVVRKGLAPYSLDTTTDYLAVPGATGGPDDLARIATVRRHFVADPSADWIDTTTAWHATYPIEAESVTDDAGAGRLNRTTTNTWAAGIIGPNLTRTVEPLNGTDSRWTDHVYNTRDDITETRVSRTGSTTDRTITRFCYSATTCATTDTTLLSPARIIEGYVNETKGGTNGHLEDVTTEYVHDTHGQRTRETRFIYQGATLLYGRGIESAFEYDTLGNLTKTIANRVDGTVAGGLDSTPAAPDWARTDVSTTFTYDTAGNQVSVADPRRAIETPGGADDYVTRTTYDAHGRAVSERQPTTPAPLGVACTPDPGCRTATTTYDELDAVRLATDADGTQQGTESDRAGRTVKTFEDPDGVGATAARQTSLLVVDPGGRLVSLTDDRQLDTSGATTTGYDELGRAISSTEAAGTADASTTVTAYDPLDQVTCVQVGWASGACNAQAATGLSTITTYDLGGRATSVTDELACTTTTYDWRDLATQLIEGRDPASCTGTGTRTISQAFDSLGRLTLRSIGSDILEANAYDSAGRVTKTWSTDGAGLRTTESWSNPLDESLAEQRYLDTLGTFTERSWTRTTRDAAGNETDRCTWSSAPAEWCHPADDPTWANPTPISRSSSEFDARNQRIRLLVPGSGETTFDPLADYQVDKVYVTTATNGFGEAIAEHVTDHRYDTRDRLDRIEQSGCQVSPGSHTCTSTPVLTGDTTYGYDDAGNRVLVTENNGSGASARHYCHDGRNQLVAVSTSSPTCATTVIETYAYDDAGNRTAIGPAGIARTFAYTAAGQLQSCTTGCGSPAFDDDGRLTAISTNAGTQPWTYQYDDDGRLTRACKASSCAGTPARLDMMYDAEGQRIRLVETTHGTSPTVTTTDFVYEGDSVVRETEVTVVPGAGTTTVTRTFITDEAGAIIKLTLATAPTAGPDDGTYLVSWNGHGDTIGLAEIDPTTGALTPAARVTYSTWGTPTVTTVNGYGDLGFRYLYVGRFDVQWDDFASAGLHYMHARHYSPEFGRFLQPDPSALEANLYGYTENSPVSRVDPSGDLSCLALLAAMAGGPPGWLTNAACWGIAGLLAMAAYTPLQTVTRAMVRAAEKAVRQDRRVDAECIVIGEGMTRVIARARLLGCDRYFGVPAQARSYYKNKDVLLKRRAYLRHNRTWLKGKVGRQYLVIDIGPDFPARRSGQRKGLSGYYLMEYLISRKTPGYIRAWDEPGKTIWSHVPRGRLEW